MRFRSHAINSSASPVDARAGSANCTTAVTDCPITGSGTLGFLVSASYGPASGTGTVRYTDGTTSSFTLSSPDWFSSSPPDGGAVALSATYQNRQGNTRYNGAAYIFYVPVTLAANKTMNSVTLPSVGTVPASAVPTLHVFAIAAGGH